MSNKSTETTIHGANLGNECPPSGSDRGIADLMVTAGLQLGYGGDQSLATEISEEEKAMEVDYLASVVFNASSEAPTLHSKKVYAYPNQSITNVLDIWKMIEEMEKVEKEVQGKIQERLDGTDSVVSRANNIHKSVKNDLGAALTYMGRLEREREDHQKQVKLMLASFKSPVHIMTNKLPGTPETNKRKVGSPPIAQSTEKKRREKDKVLIAHNQIPQKKLLVPSSTDPPASSTATKTEEK